MLNMIMVALIEDTMQLESPLMAIELGIARSYYGNADVYGIVAYHQEEPDCPGHVLEVCGTKPDAEDRMVKGAEELAWRVEHGESEVDHDVILLMPSGETIFAGELVPIDPYHRDW